ncbi:DUF551 domain-containing protein [Salmonella enterica subsp. salamae]|uniref:DUF551 domain-containing protein n=1 Tax=Salmonella enterica subsp. salamae TaxID=59202 RepID=A0A5Y3XHK8_SALER|nr:DUF551 domain-containing protein [Salmonella enterica subsp. salamae]
MSEWIKCSETKPELGIDVLVYCSDTKEQFVGLRTGKYFQYAYVDDKRVICEPSHWMPLPNPPSE